MQDCRYAAAESPNRDNRTWTGYSATASGILDYCFVSSYDYVKVLTYEVHDDTFGEGDYFSDHCAVQAKVRIYKNSEDAWSDFY